uniref:Uncharacterized protein n=1 Tax=Lygus hesperus TaxID=30085 RepID=A0A146L7I0_LYGHE
MVSLTLLRVDLAFATFLITVIFRSYFGLQSIPNILLIVPSVPALKGWLPQRKSKAVIHKWYGQYNAQSCVGTSESVIEHVCPERKAHSECVLLLSVYLWEKKTYQ